MKYEIIPLWNDISERASVIRLTKWNTAVHASKYTLEN